eukprot:241676_1
MASCSCIHVVFIILMYHISAKPNWEIIPPPTTTPHGPYKLMIYGKFVCEFRAKVDVGLKHRGILEYHAETHLEMPPNAQSKTIETVEQELEAALNRGATEWVNCDRKGWRRTPADPNEAAAPVAPEDRPNAGKEGSVAQPVIPHIHGVHISEGKGYSTQQNDLNAAELTLKKKIQRTRDELRQLQLQEWNRTPDLPSAHRVYYGVDGLQYSDQSDGETAGIYQNDVDYLYGHHRRDDTLLLCVMMIMMMVITCCGGVICLVVYAIAFHWIKMQKANKRMDRFLKDIEQGQ